MRIPAVTTMSSTPLSRLALPNHLKEQRSHKISPTVYIVIMTLTTPESRLLTTTAQPQPRTLTGQHERGEALERDGRGQISGGYVDEEDEGDYDDDDVIDEEGHVIGFDGVLAGLRIQQVRQENGEILAEVEGEIEGLDAALAAAAAGGGGRRGGRIDIDGRRIELPIGRSRQEIQAGKRR
ncbi:hypothetical protein KEM52_005820 [Ascosphaera acerosa]|nr:hypothetical protein KEM52_005820 [Ascosphaera acerosa]